MNSQLSYNPYTLSKSIISRFMI